MKAGDVFFWQKVSDKQCSIKLYSQLDRSTQTATNYQTRLVEKVNEWSWILLFDSRPFIPLIFCLCNGRLPAILVFESKIYNSSSPRTGEERKFPPAPGGSNFKCYFVSFLFIFVFEKNSVNPNYISQLKRTEVLNY